MQTSWLMISWSKMHRGKWYAHICAGRVPAGEARQGPLAPAGVRGGGASWARKGGAIAQIGAGLSKQAGAYRATQGELTRD